jgi:hypothetical protein
MIPRALEKGGSKEIGGRRARARPARPRGRALSCSGRTTASVRRLALLASRGGASAQAFSAQALRPRSSIAAGGLPWRTSSLRPGDSCLRTLRLGLGARGEPEPELVVHELWSELFAERSSELSHDVATWQFCRQIYPPRSAASRIARSAIGPCPCPSDTAKSLLPVCIST